MVPEPELIDNRITSQPDGRTSDRETLRRLARLMDSVIEIPGLNLRLGVDSLLGLVPGIGDLASTLVSLYILQAAARHDVPRVTMARMGFNVLLDTTLGSIPLLGDIFDVYWKSNLRNVELLERHLDASTSARRDARRGDTWFFAGMIAFLLLTLVGGLTITYLVIKGIADLLG